MSIVHIFLKTKGACRRANVVFILNFTDTFVEGKPTPQNLNSTCFWCSHMVVNILKRNSGM